MSEPQDDDQQPNLGFVLPVGEGVIPESAVVLSPAEVYQIRKRQLWSWPKRFEVWPLTLGPHLATAIVSLSSFAVNVNARQMFHLYAQQFFWPTTIPVIVFSSVAFWASFESFVTRPLLTKAPRSRLGTGDCDLCFETRASLIQATCGLVVPASISFLTSALVALGQRTYPIPSLTNPKALWRTLRRFAGGFRLSGPLLLGGHVVMGGVLTHMMLNANRFVLQADKQAAGKMAVYPRVS
ncbi:unnamed protein product [Calicophoron daubneyi]|uniref:Uncharacterized protein n=1 Tax=Calicophoron daubneyi TaxID=300641 RepID=A0AAV2TQR0_CALDB